jgi:hypothetical protein
MTVPLGCSFSASSKSISDSVSASSRSSSSSSPRGAESAYRDDVRSYTRTYAASGGDVEGFRRDLGALAERHGITNWEESMATYTAIGEGLAAAKVGDAELMAYKRSLSGSDPRKMDAIQKGYDSAR